MKTVTTDIATNIQILVIVTATTGIETAILLVTEEIVT